MKKNVILFLFLIAGFSLLGVSCSKHEEVLPNTPNPPAVTPDDQQPPTYPTFDAPKWAVNNVSSFEYTMTVSVIFPDSLGSFELSTDKFAIFAGDDCRGVADRIEVSSGKHVWLAMVYGNSTSETLSFKYYSSKTKYMYQSVVKKPFVVDGMLGTIDNPERIGMNIVLK